MKNIRLAHDKDLKNIEKLLDEAFGPGRYARTAYRYREKHNLISEKKVLTHFLVFEKILLSKSLH